MFGENIYCPEDRQIFTVLILLQCNRVYKTIRKTKYPTRKWAKNRSSSQKKYQRPKTMCRDARSP